LKKPFAFNAIELTGNLKRKYDFMKEWINT